jgi:hypothetical protein
MTLTREKILALVDISTKEITIPKSIPAWGGETIFIKQLTRAQQDEYLNRQFGSTRVKTKQQEVNLSGMFGHDAWICVRGVCNEDGSAIFTDKDIPQLNQKNGEAIGYIAKEILTFSGMDGDLPTVEEEVKNS